MADKTPDNSAKDSTDRPPFFKSWTALYTLVISFLALLVVLFYIFMKVYS